MVLGLWSPCLPANVLLEVSGFTEKKFDSVGNLDHRKSRLVVLGNHQKKGIDYHETFAPVAKMVIVRAFLVVAAAHNWEVHQMDIRNAFLHGDLDVKRCI